MKMNKILHTTIAGFTLAEVLITLGIIGIVAGMTIPTLINNYQKTQYSVSIKKAYTQMNQVLQQLAIDNGTIESIADYFPANSTISVGQAIASKYKVIKTCGTTQDDECFAKFDNNYDGSAHSTTVWDGSVKVFYKFITADGMSFAVYSYDNKCTINKSFAAASDAPTTNSTCGVFYIDVNGEKKPNYLGRDVFLFYITSNRTPLLYPYGGFYHSDSNTGNMTTGGTEWWNYNGTVNLCSAGSKYGAYCAGRLMEKGWEMDY